MSKKLSLDEFPPPRKRFNSSKVFTLAKQTCDKHAVNLNHPTQLFFSIFLL